MSRRKRHESKASPTSAPPADLRRPVGVRELKNQASAIVSEVRERAAEYVVTLRGEPVAVLRPYTEDDARRLRRERARASLAAVDALAEEIATAWGSEKSAAELVDEQRR
jgi:prevent-host-death family protein